MATTPLIPKQMEIAFQALTLAIANLQLTQTQPGNVYSSVRVDWQTQGQPSSDVGQDVINLRCEEISDNYNRVRDRSVAPSGQQTFRYNRAWRVYWVAYGPSGFDNMRLVKSALLQDTATQYQLSEANLYLVPDDAAPRRMPEKFPGGQWGERADYEAVFYEQVTETAPVGLVTSLEVTVEDETGQIDETITIT